MCSLKYCKLVLIVALSVVITVTTAFDEDGSGSGMGPEKPEVLASKKFFLFIFKLLRRFQLSS